MWGNGRRHSRASPSMPCFSSLLAPSIPSTCTHAGASFILSGAGHKATAAADPATAMPRSGFAWGRHHHLSVRTWTKVLFLVPPQQAPSMQVPPTQHITVHVLRSSHDAQFAAVKAHKVRPLPAPLGETVSNAFASPPPAQDPPPPPGARPPTDYRLHDHCGTDHFNACRCSHCIGGLCREKQPFRSSILGCT